MELVDKEEIKFPIVSSNTFLLDFKMAKNFAYEIFALAYLSISSRVEFSLRENSCLGNAVGEFYSR
ncbi:MAG: hypothetical protein GX941_07960 [Candidatus Methanofastidiosa archaeon]|nr:hypothetical protein [Candidatus Methanofastidiosa archaeon]